MLTFMQMLLAAGGTVAVVFSLEMSRRALRQAHVASEIQRDAAREQLRAYLGGEAPVVERFEKGNLRLTYPVKNFGATPARNVRMWGKSFYVPGLVEAVFVDLPSPEDYILNRSVPPGGVIGWTSNTVLHEDVYEWLSNSQATVVTAYLITFEDIFGHTHHVGHSELRWGSGLESRRANPEFLAAIHHLTHDVQPLPLSLRHKAEAGREEPFEWLRRLVAPRASDDAPA